MKMEEQELVKSSIEGNKQNIEKLINSIQPLIYNLSIRFLWNRIDAEDATQEILIKIITNLGKYDKRSSFHTWAYRIATNYLINLKKTILEKTFISFDVFAADLKNEFNPPDYNLPDRELLEREMKTGCTLAMLQCLDRDLRIAFILGSIFKIKSNIASTIVETSPENFRKRLEISRKLIRDFLDSHCGVYKPINHCRCNKRISKALECGRITRNSLNFGNELEFYNEEMEELNLMAGIYENHGKFESKSSFFNEITTLIKNKRIIND